MGWWGWGRGGVRPAHLRRVSEEGGSVPGSQDSQLAEMASRLSFNGDTGQQQQQRQHALSPSSVPPVDAVLGTAASQQSPSTSAAAALLVSASSRSDTVADEHAEIRRSVLDGVRSGLIGCPLCQDFRGKSAAGLMRHLSCSHAGERLGESSVVHLAALHRGVCVSPGCRAFRRFGAGHCSRC